MPLSDSQQPYQGQRNFSMIQIHTFLLTKAPPNAHQSLKGRELFEILAPLSLKAIAAATGDIKSTKQ
jgi:hypothetical protein